MYFILFLLQLGLSDFHRGGYLFTETIKGTCDFSRSSSYIYTYNVCLVLYERTWEAQI